MSDLLNNIKFKSKPVAVISSDWHMALNAWKKHPGIKGDAEYSLSQITDIALALNVPMIAAGDLFDVKNPDSYSVNSTAKQVARMNKLKLPVYYVQGQHEMSDPTWMSLFDGCVNVHDSIFKIGKLNFFGYDYFLPKSKEDSYQRFKPADILITHQVWSELLPKHGQTFCCSYTDVAKACNYSHIVSGDYHAHFQDTIYASKCSFVSPGSICLQDMNESCDKAVWVLTEDMDFISVPIVTRKLINVTINSDNDLNSVIKMAESNLERPLPNGIGRPILRVKYSPSVNNVYETICDSFKDKAFLDFKPIMDEEVSDVKVDIDPIKAVLSSSDQIFCESVSSCFPEKHRGSSDIIRLWRASNLDEIRKEISDISSELKETNNA